MFYAHDSVLLCSDNNIQSLKKKCENEFELFKNWINSIDLLSIIQKLIAYYLPIPERT